MDSFRYLTSNTTELDTFSFLTSNAEQQDQFVASLHGVATSTTSPALYGMSSSSEQADSMMLQSFTLDPDADLSMMPPQFMHCDDVIGSDSITAITAATAAPVEACHTKPVLPDYIPSSDDISAPEEQSDDAGRGGRRKRRRLASGDSEDTGDQQQQQDQQPPRDNENNGDNSGEEDESSNNGNGEGEVGEEGFDDEGERVIDEQYLKDRAWTVLHNNKDKNDKELQGKMTVEIKTRSDKAQGVMPERLYSSLKYEIRQTLSLGLRVSSTNVMMSKMEIVNPKKPTEELLKQNGEKLLRGIQDFTAVTLNKDRSQLEVKSKIQFTGVSYHHEKKYFAMKLSFFDPSYDMSKPVLVVLSAPFQVFARRPTVKDIERAKISAAKKAAADASSSPSSSSAAAAVVPEPSPAPATAKKASSKKATGVKRKASEVATSKTKPTQVKEEQKPTRLARKAKSSPAKAKQEEQPVVSDDESVADSEVSVVKEDQQMETTDNQESIQQAIDAVHDTAFSNFMNCLDLLIGFKENLRSEEQKMAMDIVRSKLFGGASPAPVASTSSAPADVMMDDHHSGSSLDHHHHHHMSAMETDLTTDAHELFFS